MTPQGRACPGFASRARQRGAVALTVGLVLLILATGGTFYVTRTSMIDQRIAADAIRARSAFEAAEAGMNFAIAFMDVDKRDLDGNSTDDRIQMLINLALTDASGPGGVDDMDDGYGREFDDCDTNGDGRCDALATTPETGGNGYLLQAIWDATDNSYQWSLPSAASACDATAGGETVRICLRLKMKVNNDSHLAGDDSVETRVEVTSTGYSDEGEGSAVKTITQDMRRVPIRPGSFGASHALITYGGVGISGAMSVVNAFSNATIWSGGEVSSFGGTNSGTFIHPDPDGPTYYMSNGDRIPFFDSNNNGTYDSGEPSLLDYTANANSSIWDRTEFTNASSGGTNNNPVVLGVDVIDDSKDLRDLKSNEDPDGFFNNFIAGPPLFAKMAADYITQSSRLTDPNPNGYAIPGSYIWVDAGNTDFSLSNGDYGTKDQPIFLVIDGNFDPKAAWRLYGVMFVRGDVVGGGSGGGVVIGSLIVEGNIGVTGSGGMDIIYDPNVVDRAGGGEGRNSIAPLSGTWRDWQ